MSYRLFAEGNITEIRIIVWLHNHLNSSTKGKHCFFMIKVSTIKNNAPS